MSTAASNSSLIETSAIVYARRRTNATGFTLIKGNRYRISCDSEALWKDGKIMCNADGWHSSQSPASTQWLVSRAERWRTVPEANWFKLIGLYAHHQQHPFALGVACEFVAHYTDTLLLAANDIALMRWNNHGELSVRIEAC